MFWAAWASISEVSFYQTLGFSARIYPLNGSAHASSVIHITESNGYPELYGNQNAEVLYASNLNRSQTEVTSHSQRDFRLPGSSVAQKEDSLAIFIELNEISEPELRQSIEDVIRGCIGDRPNDEDWRVWIRDLAGPCEITVKGPLQTRKRLFFEDARLLPEKIREWLNGYLLQ
jgi:hypothetical protein